MKRSTTLFRGLLVASALAITACGGDNGSDDNASENIDAHSIATGADTLTSEENSLSGTGSVVFTSSLGAVDSGSHFNVVASLDIGDSFTIHAYSNNQLENGIDLVVTRPNNTPTSLEVTLDGSDISSNFTSVAADQAIHILMDVHNNESPTHVVIWPEGTDEFHEEDAIENSEDSGAVTSQGAGAFWGITLSGAEVSKALASEAQFDDEH